MSLAFLLAVAQSGCFTAAEKAEVHAHGPALRSALLTEHVGDVEGCRSLGPVRAVTLVALREHAALLGADVVYHEHVALAWKYLDGTAYDCGGRYVPTIKAIPQ